MNVKEIVLSWLEANGYEGLYNSDGECGCEIADLMPCCEAFDSCLPGYKAPYEDGERDWQIQEEKPKGE